MQDRLIELIHESDLSLDSVRLADHLIANGVIVLPCKVGDTVYSVKGNFIKSDTVVGFHLGRFPTLRGQARKEYLVCYNINYLSHIDIAQIGKTVFFTREEAEKALAKMKGGAG